MHPLYRTFKIPKSGNQFRLVYAAPPARQAELRSLLPLLEAKLDQLDSAGVVYAFRSGRNCALNALQHVGFRFTLSMDISDFFDHVTIAHVAPHLPADIIDQCFIDGAPRQGLPTSPVIANIALADTDKAIIAQMERLVGDEVCYTRYADDITISFNQRRKAPIIEHLVRTLLEAQGFQIHPRKTKLQHAANGRRIITGIAVDHRGIYPTRKTKRKLRAAIHQGNLASVRGLQEWSKLKLPVPKPPQRKHQRIAEAPSTSETPFSVLLFDLDNTLLHTDDLKRFRRRGPANAETFINDLKLAVRTEPDKRLIYTKEQLTAIKRRYPAIKLGIFTRAPRLYTETLLKIFYRGIGWDIVLTHDDLPYVKPHPAGIDYVMRGLGIDAADQIALVGDDITDVLVAYRSGCWSIFDTSRWETVPPFTNRTIPDLQLTDGPEQLLALLEQPEKGLPLLEQRIACAAVDRPTIRADEPTPLPSPGRILEQVFHIPGQEHPETVQVLGRYITLREPQYPKAAHHILSQQIRAHKDATTFPRSWSAAVLEAIADFLQQKPWLVLPLTVTVIPPKPGRVPHLQHFFQQIEEEHAQWSAYSRLEVSFSYDLLAFDAGVASHHNGRLKRQARIDNIRRYLYTPSPSSVEGRHILLVDDVITSGATLLTAKERLMESGAASVHVMALAQTVTIR